MYIMGKKNKSKTGAVPSPYYEMNVDQVAVEEEEKPQDDALTDIKGNVVYRVSYAEAVKSILEDARSIQVQSIGEEIPKDEASLGVIDLSASVVDDDALSQKQKQQKGSYWFWWRK
jgi:hypothetical protein